MNRYTIFMASALSVAIFNVAGCGGGDPASTNDGPASMNNGPAPTNNGSEGAAPTGPLNLDQFATKVSAKMCPFMMSCCAAKGILLPLSMQTVATEAECEATFSAAAHSLLGAPGVALLEEQAGKCYDTVVAMLPEEKCTDNVVYIARPDACLEVTKAMLAAGDKCMPGLDLACPTSLVCDGACVKPLADGEACPKGVGCASGSFCNSSMTCQAKKADGESCAGPTECASVCFKGVCAMPAYEDLCGS